jgi:hypothetical protein
MGEIFTCFIVMRGCWVGVIIGDGYLGESGYNCMDLKEGGLISGLWG